MNILRKLPKSARIASAAFGVALIAGTVLAGGSGMFNNANGDELHCAAIANGGGVRINANGVVQFVRIGGPAHVFGTNANGVLNTGLSSECFAVPVEMSEFSID